MSLSRLKVGADVPWVTSWTGEPHSDVRPCDAARGRLAVMQAERPGHGRPLYSRNHLIRQRRSVVRMLCPMCGGATAEDDRWSQTGRYTSAGALRLRGFAPLLPRELKDAAVMLDAGAIAPLHRACAERALNHCPHLSQMPDHTLKPFPASWIEAPLWIEGRSQLGAPVPVVSFIQLFGITGETDKRWRKTAKR
jgi:hypothetical protein